jgi:hypothetical protein
MILDLPKIGSVRFDDNLTDEQFNAQLQALSQKYGFEVPRGLWLGRRLGLKIMPSNS